MAGEATSGENGVHVARVINARGLGDESQRQQQVDRGAAHREGGPSSMVRRNGAPAEAGRRNGRNWLLRSLADHKQRWSTLLKKSTGQSLCYWIRTKTGLAATPWTVTWMMTSPAPANDCGIWMLSW